MVTAPPAPTTRSVETVPQRTRTRLRGVDVARGLAVIGMLFVDNRGSEAVTRQLVHEDWNGLHFADLVFPVFLLIVGVSIPFSTRAQRPRAVLWRVAKLAALGFLIVTAKYGWGTVGVGVLGHIAGAYLLCWLLLRLPQRLQIPVAVGLLAAIGVLLLRIPVPGAGRAVLDPDVSWASWLDRTIGLSFGAESPHSYLPSALTVFVGVLAGRVLRAHPGREALPRLAWPGVGLVASGLLLATVLPLNKQIWTPSYVLVTGGTGLLVLAATHWLVDVRGVRRPFRPAEVLGLNAIVAFSVSELLFRAVLAHHVQPAVVGWLSGALSPVAAAYLYPAVSVVVVWAACALLARRGIVVRI